MPRRWSAPAAGGAAAGDGTLSIKIDLYKWRLYFGAVHAFEVLGDPVRRRILELIAGGEQSSGEVCAVIRREFGISQPAVSQHLKVLRDSGFATVRPAGTRRLYAVNPGALREVDDWLERFRRFWAPPLMALGTELARGRRERQAGSRPAADDRSEP